MALYDKIGETIVIQLARKKPKFKFKIPKIKLKLPKLTLKKAAPVCLIWAVATLGLLPQSVQGIENQDVELMTERGALNAAREGDDYNPAQASAALHFTIIQGKVFNDSTLLKAEKRINHGLAYHQVITDPINAELFSRLKALSHAGANPYDLKAVRGSG